MADNDQTIMTSRGAEGLTGAPSPEPPKKGRNPLLIIGGVGCLLLLCALLAVGGAYFLVRDQVNEIMAGLPGSDGTFPTEVTVVEEPTATPIAAVVETPTEAPTATPAPTDTPTPAAPTISSVTFATGVTGDNQPVDPGTEFEGDVTEVHAIFEYSGFSPETTWERVWYLDGEEMLRSSETWSGDSAGVFDYFVNAGGDPLSPGEWTLELYVDGELLATDSFTIVGDTAAVADASASATPTPESAAATDTPTPTVEASPTVAPTPRPVAKTYKLAYTKWDGGKHLLYIGDTNGGSEQYMLGRAAGPSWTPDGGTIFFFGEEGIDRQVLPDGREFVFDGVSNGIVAIDMSPVPTTVEQVQLYQGNDWKFGTARWANVSPDGKMVAFDAKPSGSYRIYFLGTNDNQQYRFELLGEQGDWSPDSQKFVYRSGRDGKTGIWASNRDDSGHVQLTSGGNDSFPAWSPDGKTIVFHREDGGNVDLYAMNADGSNVRRLTDAPGPDTLPEFTPSGEIIFRSARSGNWGIWKMNIDGSNQKEIIPNAGVGPDWSGSRMSVLP